MYMLAKINTNGTVLRSADVQVIELIARRAFVPKYCMQHSTYTKTRNRAEESTITTTTTTTTEEMKLPFETFKIPHEETEGK